MTTIAPSTVTYHLTCDEEHGWAAVYSTCDGEVQFRGFVRVDDAMLHALHRNPATRLGEDGLLRCTFPA